MPRIEEPAEPWRSFFADVDSRLSEDVELHCCGGFVATQLLRLFALEAHDLALSKLERNMERDRDDVQQLACAGYLRADIAPIVA